VNADADVELSIVVPVLNEEAAVEPFVDAVDAVLPSLGLSGHEYVFRNSAAVVLFAFLLGWTSLSTGILGLYVAQILNEVKRQPLFLVADTLGLPPDRVAQLDKVAQG